MMSVKIGFALLLLYPAHDIIDDLFDDVSRQRIDMFLIPVDVDARQNSGL